MWTTETRARYDRKGLLYPSDLTDEEWSHVELVIRAARSVIILIFGLMTVR